MRFLSATILIALAAIATFGQSPPTLRIVTETPGLPSELFYGDVKVKPLRLRPGTNVPITINDPDFYVSQQYVDFLGRFPDQSGFGFWQNEITSCGGNAGCVEVKRINVSAAFFLSIEFQDTGYLVYKMHKAAFGDRFGNSQPGSPKVPIRRAEFLPDTKTIANGIVVGDPGWENALNANKNAFALAFVQRAAFQTAFPAGLTAQQFVDQLDNNAGQVLNSGEKANLVSILGGTPADPAKRAQVLRSIADNQNMHSQNLNKAFVLMQYFGYLRRDPDSGPDTNFDGYNFWLQKLNDFNGNYVNAEMVKAFIVSGEYLNRF
ncbi:MAG: hypothetical protein DMF69_18265 [Acidobacteria bacterium]|nr:MAG: hypothetical protein DMF69_18265 [Acidobacteriota bacterium]